MARAERCLNIPSSRSSALLVFRTCADQRRGDPFLEELEPILAPEALGMCITLCYRRGSPTVPLPATCISCRFPQCASTAHDWYVQTPGAARPAGPREPIGRTPERQTHRGSALYDDGAAVEQHA